MTNANIPTPPASVLHSLNLVSSQLDGLLTGLSAYDDAANGLRQLAHEVAAATAQSPIDDGRSHPTIRMSGFAVSRRVSSDQPVSECRH